MNVAAHLCGAQIAGDNSTFDWAISNINNPNDIIFGSTCQSRMTGMPGNVSMKFDILNPARLPNMKIVVGTDTVPIRNYPASRITRTTMDGNLRFGCELDDTEDTDTPGMKFMVKFSGMFTSKYPFMIIPDEYEIGFLVVKQKGKENF